jgi:hypothetical protein
MGAVHGPTAPAFHVPFSEARPCTRANVGPWTVLTRLATTRNCNANPHRIQLHINVVAPTRGAHPSSSGPQIIASIYPFPVYLSRGNCCTNLCFPFGPSLCCVRRLVSHFVHRRPGPQTHHRDPAPLLPPRGLRCCLGTASASDTAGSDLCCSVGCGELALLFGSCLWNVGIRCLRLCVCGRGWEENGFFWSNSWSFGGDSSVSWLVCVERLHIVRNFRRLWTTREFSGSNGHGADLQRGDQN